MLHWIYLIFAGLFEVGFTSSLVMAENSTGRLKLLWFGAFGVSLVVSMLLLLLASRQILMSTSYAVFAGVGAAGTALMGIFVFHEEAGFWRLFFLVTLIVSIVGLNLTSPGK